MPNPGSIPNHNPNALRQFVQAVTHAVSSEQHEPVLLATVRAHLATLVTHDDWLPDELAQPHPQFYRQYLLHCDALERFSVVSFVWGPGQKTPVHDHTVWGIIGMLRGAENGQRFAADAQGHWAPVGERTTLQPGDLDIVSPSRGDVHEVANALGDRVSISIHLYGGNIGRIQRHVFAPDTGESKAFISGYSNALSPNLWAKAAA